MPVYEFARIKPRIAPTAFVHPEAVVIGASAIGERCFIGPGAVVRADFGPIQIGDDTSIQDQAVIHVSPGCRVIVGKEVIIAHHAVLHDVLLGDRCVIGMGALLLQHVVCEEDAFVAAGSVVLHGTRIPRGMLSAGNPARVVKAMTQEAMAAMASGVEQYKSLVQQYRMTMVRLD